MGARRGVAKKIAGCNLKFVEELENRRLLSISWFVATSGKDTNAGTLAAPFQTIQHAASLAKAGDTVLIRGGVYHETVKPANSGTSAAPITFTAYQSESVTISGADPVTGWSKVSGTSSTYAATQGWDLGINSNQLFVDGQMMNLARWPNPSGNIEQPATSTFQSVTVNGSTVTIKDSNIGGAANFWKGTYIQFGAGQEWFQQTSVITASGPGFLTFSYISSTNSPKYDTPVAGNHYFLFGNLSLLNVPTEWMRDLVSGKVDLIAPGGVNPNSHDVEAKHRQYSFDVSGRSYITISRIHTFASTINSDSASGHLLIDHLDARFLTHWTLQPTGHAPTSSTGIALDGPASVIQNSRITNSAGDGVFLGGAGSRVTNCVITNTDYSGSDSAPVRVCASGCQVDHCSIAGAGQNGILLRVGDAKVLYNDIHDCGLNTTDCGGIYAIRQNGAGGEIAYNRIYNVTTGGFGGTGIQLDDYCSNFLIDHNVTWNVNVGIKSTYNSFNDRIYNNTLDATDASILKNAVHDWSGTQIYNNIFVQINKIGDNAKVADNLDSTTPALFVDRSSHNYQLKSASPAIDKGIAIPPFTTGYKGAAPDIGAYELGVTPFVVGAIL